MKKRETQGRGGRYKDEEEGKDKQEKNYEDEDVEDEEEEGNDAQGKKIRKKMQ